MRDNVLYASIGDPFSFVLVSFCNGYASVTVCVCLHIRASLRSSRQGIASSNGHCTADILLRDMKRVRRDRTYRSHWVSTKQSIGLSGLSVWVMCIRRHIAESAGLGGSGSSLQCIKCSVVCYITFIGLPHFI